MIAKFWLSTNYECNLFWWRVEILNSFPSLLVSLLSISLLSSKFHLGSVKWNANHLGIFRLTLEKKILLQSHLKQPQDFQNVNFREKLKILKSGTKIVLFGCFVQQFLKTVARFEMSTLNIVKMWSFMQNLKTWIWDQEYLIWVFLSGILKKTIVYLKQALSNLLKWKKFT